MQKAEEKLEKQAQIDHEKKLEARQEEQRKIDIREQDKFESEIAQREEEAYYKREELETMRKKNRQFEEEIRTMQRETQQKQLAADKALTIQTRDETMTRQEESEKKKLEMHMKETAEESSQREQ